MHYWSSPKLRRLAQRQRDVDRVLTKLETMPLPTELVLGAMMVRCIPNTFTVSRRARCRNGAYWYHIARKRRTMPYIKRDKRAELAAAGLGSVATALETTGDLNYAISFMANQMVRDLPKKSYAGMSAIRGAISDAADEFYRRVMAGYEDQKCQENGDVYDGSMLVCSQCGHRLGMYPTGTELICPTCLAPVTDAQVTGPEIKYTGPGTPCEECHKREGWPRFQYGIVVGFYCAECWAEVH